MSSRHDTGWWIRRVVGALAVVAIAAAAMVGAIYFGQTPPEPQRGQIRLTTIQQLRGGSPRIQAVHTVGQITWSVEFDGVWSGSRIDDGLLQINGRISIVRDGVVETNEFEFPPLDVGDTLEFGPATIEVMLIHDAVFSRNEAADIVVTFDETLFDQPLPSESDIIVTPGTS